MTDHQAYNFLKKQVKRAQFRLNLFMLFRFWLKTIFYILLGESVVFALLKLTPWDPPSLMIGLISLGVSFPIAFVAIWQNRKDIEDTSILVDQHLKLKEKISSALEFSTTHEVYEEQAEWRRAQLFDALKEAKRLDLRQAFPWCAPVEAKWLWAPLCAFLMVAYVIPQWQWFTGDMRSLAQAQEMEKKRVQKEAKVLLKRQIELEKRAESKEMEKAATTSKEIKELLEKMSKGKIEKREALAKISSLEKKSEKEKDQLQAMKDQVQKSMPMHQMKMLGQIAKDVQAGEFKKAAQELEKLQKKLKMGDLSEEQKERLAEELKKMASNMDNELPMSKALSESAMELEAGELDAALASLNMAEMNLKDMADMMKQLAMLDSELKELGECKLGLLGKCSKCGGNCNGDGVCESCGTGPWKAGYNPKQGNGMGGPGIGRGGQAQFAETGTGFKKSSVKGEFNKGPISGLLKVKGKPTEGQSYIELSEAAFSYNQQEEDALVNEQVPIPYRNHVRAYFDSLNSAESTSTSQGE